MPRKLGDLTLFSVDDLHQELGLSKLTIRNYLKSGRLKGRKLGVSWYVTEDALREYFEHPHQEQASSKRKMKELKYIVQGINDLVSETEECKSIEEAIEVLNDQAILSLFQVAIVNKETDEVIELLKAREFLERHAS